MNQNKNTQKRSFAQKIAQPKRKKMWLIIFWSAISLPFVAMGSLILLVVCGAFGTLPSFEELENPQLNIATDLISSDGKTIGNFYIENRSYVDYSDLSENLVAALVSTEDSRFYSHSGIDFIGLTRVAFKSLMLSQNQGGGSTISQQLAKNLYPRDTTKRSSIGRVFNLVISKLKEWVTATMLEYNYTKEEIVTMYLNTMDYGSYSFGIKSAAQTFFNKSPKDVTVPEAAMLVGVVNAPTRYSPVRNPENALKRRNTVISRMAEQGYITEDKAEEYKKEPINLDYNLISHNAGSATYFREMVRLYMTAKEPQPRQFLNDWDYQADLKRWKNDPLYGWCNKNKKADGTTYDLYRDGLKIYSTINSKMQAYAEEAVQEQMGNPKEGVQARFNRQREQTKRIFFNITPDEQNTIMRNSILRSERARVMRLDGASNEEIIKAFDTPRKMKVFTYQGDRDTTLSPKDSILHYKSILRTGFMAMDPSNGYVLAYVGGPSFKHFKYDMVKQGRRQVGSTVKPFIYTFAFDYLGYNPCTEVPNLPVSIETGSGDAFSPKEAGKVEYDGVMHPLRWGLANSRNNYSAWIMKQSSPEAVTDLIHKMGITNWIDPVYSVCTGSPEVTIFEMVGAFGTFANRGVHTDPMFVTRIEDKQGNVLSSFSPNTIDAISEQTAYTMLSMLQSNITQGTGGRLRYQFKMNGEVGGKTGTTNNNSDAWFMAVTPKVVAGAWVGGEDRATHLQYAADGSRLALPIFGHFMTKVYADKSLGISLQDRFMPPVGMVNLDCESDSTEEQEMVVETEEITEDEFFQ